MPLIYDNKVCVYADELIKFNPRTRIGSDKGFISEANYYKMKKSNQIVILQRSTPTSSAIVDFETMREDIKRKYIEKNGDPRVALSREERMGILEEAIVFSPDASSFYTGYRYNGDRCLPPRKIEEYVNNARVIEGILALKRQYEETRVGRSGRVRLWERLSALTNELLDLRDADGSRIFPHTLPGTPATLKRRVDAYEKAQRVSREEAWRTLIHKNYGNKSASLVTDADMEAVLHKLISLHNNLNCVQIMEEYNKVAAAMGIKPIRSRKTVENYKHRMELTTMRGRRGEKAVMNTRAKQVHRIAPDQAMTYWTLDGWTVELVYQKKSTRTDNGRECQATTFTNRKTAVIVLDACCKYPVGYAIGDHESPALIRQAMRNALQHTRELFGQRYMPVQIQSDNYQKSVMKPFFEGLTRYYTPAAVGNAKSKIIEPYFRYLNVEYCQKQANWSGFGITARTEAQPNLEALNELRHYVPDEDTVIGQIHFIIAQEREKKRGAYMEAWERTVPERRLPLSDTEYLLRAGERVERTGRITGNGLTVDFGGNRLKFDCLDSSLREHYDEEWIVRYDPEDLGRVLVSNAVRKGMKGAGEEIGSLRYLMERDVQVPMALADQQEEHFEYRKRVRAFNRQLRDHIRQREQETDDRIRTIRQRIPDTVSGGLLDRYLLTDSRGQHKDARSRERDRAAFDEFEELVQALPPEQPAPARKPAKDDSEDYELDVQAFIDNDF